ncbi:hypothetical protein ABKW28_19385 [Nocardioides sp. 31GB23]|uniref:hypothetical protein n=1 Tax=Nocardioides sp. 31GB23 TaxID=3156065 RepID=UPI0032B02169
MSRMNLLRPKPPRTIPARTTPRRTNRRRGLRCVLTATGLVVAVSLAGCAADEGTESDGTDPTTETSQPSPSAPDPSATADATEGGSPTAIETPSEEASEADLAVVIDGEEVAPNAAELSAAPGEALTVQVTSDRAGELHVHAKPEQFLEFDEGQTSMDLVIDTPGTVEVEDHDTSAVVAIITVG